jgi:predicted Zn-dependent peptidase
VKDNEIAQAVQAFTSQRPGPGLEQIAALVRPGKEVAAIEKMIYDEVAKLQSTAVEDWEMEKVKMALRRSQVSGAQSTIGRAMNLADSYVQFGDAGLVNTEFQKMAKVSKDDIMRVAKKYLVETNRSVIITMPKAKPAGPAGQ